MIKTSASLLTCDLADISGELSRCKAANVDWIHFDVMDGAFVDQITYGSPVLNCVRRATDMFLDVHLMVNDPASQIKFFAEAGADLISFHLESRSDLDIEERTPENAMSMAEEIRQLRSEVKRLNNIVFVYIVFEAEYRTV